MRMVTTKRRTRRGTNTPTNTEVCLEPLAADIVEAAGLVGEASVVGLDGLGMPTLDSRMMEPPLDSRMLELASWTLAGDRLLADGDIFN